MTLSDPSTLYGSPTTISAGCHSRSSAPIAAQRSPPTPTGTASRGAAVRLTVSPQATPMRRSPKSKARTTRGAPLAGPSGAAVSGAAGSATAHSGQPDLGIADLGIAADRAD